MKHVAVPCIKPTLTNQTTFPEPAGAQETPSVDKDGKQHEQNGKPQQKKQKKTPKEQSKKEGSSKQAKGIREILPIYVRPNFFVLTNSNTCPFSRKFMSIVQIILRDVTIVDFIHLFFSLFRWVRGR